MIEPRAALEAIGQLPDTEIDIVDAALQLARVELPSADWQAVREQLSALAREAVQLGGEIPDDDLTARAGMLAGLIGDRHGYQGDTETYDDLANANLIRVVERRRGLPVALGIIWLHTARAVGWTAHGIDFPGHFLLALRTRGEQVVADVFDRGVLLNARDLRALHKRFAGHDAELQPDLLRPMGTRAVLLRLQNNIKLRRLQAGEMAAALACTEDMLRIAPDEPLLWRDAALLNQRLDQVTAALRCFERFLKLVPQGDAARRARAVMDELRSRLN